jgi:NADH dehydrogenase
MRRARFRHARVRLTIVDRRNHHVFQPLLNQVAMAALSPGDIASPIRWILRRQSNAEVISPTCAIGSAWQPILAERRGRLRLSDRRERRDARTRTRRWRAIARAPTIDDALDIRRRVLLALNKRAEREADPPGAAPC